MSEPTESKEPSNNQPLPAEGASAGASPRPLKASQPSFDDIMAAVDAPPPKPAPRPTPPPPAPPPQKSALQPSFEEIMAGASQPPPAAARSERSGEKSEPSERRGPPKPRKEERKWPVVVRKINLPKTGDQVRLESARAASARPEGRSDERAERASGESQSSGEQSANGEENQAGGSSGQDGQALGQEGHAGASGAEQGGQRRGPRHGRDDQSRKREPREPTEARVQQPLAESKFAQPGADEESDFGALFAEAGSGKRQRLSPGAKVSGKIAHVGAEVALLDLGGKGEGIIDLRELRDEKGELTVHAGDSVDGYVLSAQDGSVVITRSVPKGAGREILQAAFAAGLPVEGLVTAHNKGGLEVDLGGQRAFCPSSQIDIRFVDDPSVFVGQKLKFRVTELRGGNAVLSRRALLEEERKGKAEELRANLHVGANLEGVVTSVRDFGAFVDLGGLEGLIHVSELSHARVGHAQEVVKVGQKVKVQVLRIEAAEKSERLDKADKGERDHKHKHGDRNEKSEKIALSLKALEQDPWDAHRASLSEGQKLQGKVARLQPFGAFVELFPGVDGLVHVSALASKHVTHPREVVKEGETIWVQIESIDDTARRVALRKITEEEAAQEGPVGPRAREGREPREGQSREPKEHKPAPPRVRPGDVVDATVEKCEAFGIFVTFANGALRGMIPNAELGTPRGSDNKKTNPPGMQFKAQVLDIDDRGRYRLSKTSAEAAIDRAEYQEYQSKMKKAAGKGFGTLGDLLRAKLAQKDE